MINLKELFKTFIVFFLINNAFAGDFHLKTGDLLFQAGEKSEMNEAISGVTSGENHCHYTHVGIVSIENDTVFVIEATTPAVCKTPVNTFLSRSAHSGGLPVVAVGRLKPEYDGIIPQAVARAKKLIGKPYDYVYCPDNDAYYCSELVVLSFIDKDDEPLFQQINMTFRDADGIFPAYWVEHFQKYNAEIPEGLPGSNPGDLSKSDKIEIVYRYWNEE